MAYDEETAHRIREALADQDGVVEKRGFGGLMFLVNGNVAVAALARGDLMVRCAPAQTDELVAAAGVARMEMRGRELDGWLQVDASALETDEQLAHWVRVGADYAGSLPPK